MNLQKMVFTLAIAASLLLSACGAPATQVPTAEPTATEIPTDTPQPTPTETLTPEPSPTTDLTAQPPAAETPGAPAANPNAPAAPASSAADQYQYVSQTLPDNYQVRPGVQVSISWTVKNVGSTAWSTSYALRQFTGPDIGKAYIPFPKAVSANTTTQFTVTFTTPTVPGDYNLWYKLTNELGQNFGDINFQFTVTNTPNNNAKPAAPTATP